MYVCVCMWVGGSGVSSVCVWSCMHTVQSVCGPVCSQFSLCVVLYAHSSVCVWSCVHTVQSVCGLVCSQFVCSESVIFSAVSLFVVCKTVCSLLVHCLSTALTG